MREFYYYFLLSVYLFWTLPSSNALTNDPIVTHASSQAVTQETVTLKNGDPGVASALTTDYLRPFASTDHHLGCFFVRDQISIQDGLLELLFLWDLPEEAARKNLLLEVIIHSLQPDRPVQSVAFFDLSSTEARLLVQADMSLGPPGLYRIEGLLHQQERILSRVEGLITNPVYPKLTESFDLQIPLDWPDIVGNFKEECLTIGFGLPFPAGALWELPSIQATDDTGQAVPFKADISRYWRPGGSIQWLRCWAQVTFAEFLNLHFNFPQADIEPINPVILLSCDVEKPTAYTIQVGEATYQIKPDPTLLTLVKDHKVLANGSPYLVNQKGEKAHLASEGLEIRLEQSDPLRSVIRIEGDYRTSVGTRLARCIIRFDFRANFPAVLGAHTLILTEDTDRVQLKELGWEWLLKDVAAHRAVFARTANTGFDSEVSLDQWQSVTLAQTAYPAFADETLCLMQIEKSLTGTELKTEKAGSIGDWVAVQGQAGGVLMVVPDFARQFPVDFEVSQAGLTSRLFSPRAGFAIDLRAPAMVERWKLEHWVHPAVLERYRSDTGKDLADFIEQIKAIKVNGVGWARTHEFLVAPLLPDCGDVPSLGEYLAASCTNPVFAAPSPDWTYQSRAMGPLRPRDPERFGYVENWVDRVLGQYTNYCYNGGFAGFFDYRAGPTYRGVSTGTRRYRLTYTFRADIWRYYARSLDRSARLMAEDTNKGFIDNMLCHWDDHGRLGQGTTQGLYFWDGPEGYYDDQPHSLPFLGSSSSVRTILQLLSSTNLDQFEWLYQIAGYDRARDILEQMAEGALRLRASLDRPYCGGRQLMELRVWVQLYRYLGDPRLRQRALELLDYLYQPESYLKTTAENRLMHSNTYKVMTDIRALMDAYDILGDQRLSEMVRVTSEYLWNTRVSAWPVTYTSPVGVAALNLYQNKPRADVATQADFFLRWLAAGCHAGDDVRHSLRGMVSASSSTAAFEVVPYLEDVVIRSNADKEILASWIGFMDSEAKPAVVYFQKEENQDVFDITAAVAAPLNHPVLGDRIRVECVSLSVHPKRVPGAWIMGNIGSKTHTATGKPADIIRITSDTEAGIYRIVPRHQGEHVILSDRRIPMVLYAPLGWAPLEAQNPWPVFFKVDPGARKPRVYFEGSMWLFDPENERFAGDKPLTGWVDLPEDKPGLWKLIIADPISGSSIARKENARWIQVENIRPLFALGDPKFYFVPPLD